MRGQRLLYGQGGQRGIRTMRRTVTAALSLCLGLGCTHTLAINNYPGMPSVGAAPPRPLVVGLVSQGGAPYSEQYVDAIARGLQLQASVERVVYPYAKGSSVDVIANVDVNPEYKGAGTNFFVNFPGWLVFAPAWNGYKYQANPRTRVELTTPDGSSIGEISWEHNYVFHQADMGRTWTEVSWFEVGIIALIGGIVFVQYDPDQTPHFIEEVSNSYGRQVAVEISRGLANYSPLKRLD